MTRLLATIIVLCSLADFFKWENESNNTEMREQRALFLRMKMRAVMISLLKLTDWITLHWCNLHILSPKHCQVMHSVGFSNGSGLENDFLFSLQLLYVLLLSFADPQDCLHHLGRPNFWPGEDQVTSISSHTSDFKRRSIETYSCAAPLKYIWYC